MAERRQILVLEDLGISSEEFDRMVGDLPYDIVRSEKDCSPDSVEILVNVKKTIGKETLDKYPQVKMIAVAFTGYDSVDLEEANNRNIAIYNVPGYSTNSVAELTIGLVISLLRRILESDRVIRSGEWNVRPGVDLAGKTVGILGTGKIGLKVASFFNVMGCELIGWSRTEKQQFKEMGGKYYEELRDVISEADIISIHTPYSKHTENLIGSQELNAMKPSAFLVNTARGPIVNEAAVISALKEKRIAGAALDVFAKEPIDGNNELLKLENVILTPHIAFKTEEALKRRAETTVNNILDFAKGNKGNRVN